MGEMSKGEDWILGKLKPFTDGRIGGSRGLGCRHHKTLGSDGYETQGETFPPVTHIVICSTNVRRAENVRQQPLLHRENMLGLRLSTVLSEYNLLMDFTEDFKGTWVSMPSVTGVDLLMWIRWPSFSVVRILIDVARLWIPFNFIARRTRIRSKDSWIRHDWAYITHHDSLTSRLCSSRHAYRRRSTCSRGIP